MDNIEDTLNKLDLLRKEAPQPITLDITTEIGSHLLDLTSATPPTDKPGQSLPPNLPSGTP